MGYTGLKKLHYLTNGHTGLFAVTTLVLVVDGGDADRGLGVVTE